MKQFFENFVRFFQFQVSYPFIIQLMCASIGAILCLKKDFRKKNDLIFMGVSFLILIASSLLLSDISSSFFIVVQAESSTSFAAIGLIFSIILINTAYICIFCKDAILSKLLKISLFISATYVCTQITYCFNMICLQNGISMSVADIGRSFVHLLIVITGFIEYRYNVGKFKTISLPGFVIGILSFAFLFIIAFLTGYISDGDTYTYSVLLVILFFFLCVELGIYFFVYFSERQARKELELQAQVSLNEASKVMLELNEESIQRATKTRHDIKNHFSYIEAMLNNQKYEEAIAYFHTLSQDSFASFHIIDCGNMAVSSIMNLELSKASINGIELKYLLAVPQSLPFQDTDLCSILTNLIDNSMEEVMRIEDKEKKIVDIKVYVSQDYLRIRVINPTDQTKIENNSSRKGIGHGYGMKIVKKIASKYEGFASFKIEECQFVADVLLLMDKKEENNA